MKICDLEMERDDIRRAITRAWRRGSHGSSDLLKLAIENEIWELLKKSEDRGGD